MYLLGVDTGGTFTDFVLWDGHVLRAHKVLSTPDHPEKAILQGITDLGLESQKLHIVHGSTVATNAVLEGRLARTVFVTNRGMKDMLTIGRQARSSLYDLSPSPRPPPVSPELCIETAGRIDAEGNIIEPLDKAGESELVAAIKRLKPRSVAINLLFSFLDDKAEKRIESLVPEGIAVTRSSSLLPVYREYERGMTTWLNAATMPVMNHYLSSLDKQTGSASLAVMQSSGDSIDIQQAAARSAYLLLSGPAGGLIGAQALTRQAGYSRVITFDMGGTSTDVSLIDGKIRLSEEGDIAGYPVSVPMVDIHTIGAGGGSQAHLDEGGFLHVGPRSSGANPGPACYGLGGRTATVTDANLVLGRIPASASLGGQMVLDRGLACRAMKKLATRMNAGLEQAAEGIINVVNENMAAALRVISVERGHDPEEFLLCCYGGAGGLHVCDLAERLGIKRALAPVHAGVLSALGMLYAPRGRRLMRTCIRRLSGLDLDEVESLYAGMQAEAMRSLVNEGISRDRLDVQREVDMRYTGQASSLRVEWNDIKRMAEDFHALHRQHFGHDLDVPLELVNLHCTVQADMTRPGLARIKGDFARQPDKQEVFGVDKPVTIYQRASLAPGQHIQGPAILVEDESTLWLAPGWNADMDAVGNLMLTMSAGR